MSAAKPRTQATSDFTHCSAESTQNVEKLWLNTSRETNAKLADAKFKLECHLW